MLLCQILKICDPGDESHKGKAGDDSEQSKMKSNQISIYYYHQDVFSSTSGWISNSMRLHPVPS